MAIEDQVSELEAAWNTHDFDNYKDALEICNDLLESPLQARVIAVLNAVISEIEEVADPEINAYLGEWGTRAFWEQLVGRPLAP